MQSDTTKKLIDCFEYLKKYYLDIFDALQAMLEFLLLQRKYPDSFKLALSDKQEALKNFFLQYKLSHPMLLNGNIKLTRLERILHDVSIHLCDIEAFFHIITQQKTSNKLYYYSTPLQINRLLIGLLDIQKNEEVYNPCYGMGSVFLSLAQMHTEIKIFGEELDSKLSNIALMITKICDFDSTFLYVNDLLKNPHFIKEDEAKKFDKILCNPPMYAHMGLESLKKDPRFSQIGTLAKHYSELIFLTHSLAHLKKRGVFIIRNQVLHKTSLEAKVREKLIKEKMIEAIIELPKNIFPLQNHDLSIIVLAPNSKSVLFINSNDGFFYQKDGKYNYLVNLDFLIDIFRTKKQTPYSKITSLKDLNKNDLRASFYVNKQRTNGNYSLRSLGFQTIRGQRVYGGKNDEKIDFFDVGIADFKILGPTNHFENLKKQGDKKKIKKYALKPYDILFSLRGNTPKLTLLGEDIPLCVANTGVVVLRNEDRQKSLNVYCYFFTKEGEKHLQSIYEKSAENVLDCEKLLGLNLPKNYYQFAELLYEKILNLSKEMQTLEEKIAQVKLVK